MTLIAMAGNLNNRLGVVVATTIQLLQLPSTSEMEQYSKIFFQTS
jgi:hypothetical protein